MSAKELLHRYLDVCPLVAIIRGVRPDEAEAIGDAIHEAGIRIIEVPLNSPDALSSIERLVMKFGDSVLVGAGTVLDPADVGRVRDAGGRIIVSPTPIPP
jgi:2-dehydro-3-deoxyphosphogalactonate aldolase